MKSTSKKIEMASNVEMVLPQVPRGDLEETLFAHGGFLERCERLQSLRRR
jgi:hypothetical protein